MTAHRSFSTDHRYSVTTNLDQALDALSTPEISQTLHLTRSLDEALSRLTQARAFQPQTPEATVEGTLRVASTVDDFAAIHRLIHDAYVEQGYIEPQGNGRLLYNAEFDQRPETVVLMVESEGVLLGTLSLTVDGPRGLPVDRDFNATCNLVRREGRPLGCVWRLVTRQGYVDERRLVLTLIGEIVQEGLARQIKTYLCALNPKHERFYKRLLNMKSLAYCRSVQGLRNAPGVCMRGDVENLPPWWTHP